jgi:hypothetical protein
MERSTWRRARWACCRSSQGTTRRQVARDELRELSLIV